MSGNFNIQKLDPTIFIGDSIATYIKNTPLAQKITHVTRAIFVGLFTFFSFIGFFKYASMSFPLPIILPFSIGMALFFLFFETVMLGHLIKKNQ